MKKAAGSYVLSNYAYIFNGTIDNILNVGYRLKDGCPIPSFDEDLLINLCSDVQSVFEKENNILTIDGDFVIVGDIHGSLHDLLRILKFLRENSAKVLFLGDYVDRGEFSLECITLLFAIKSVYPEKCFMLRGNHEFDSLCSNYGFRGEIIHHNSYKKVENQIYVDDVYTMNNSLDHYRYSEKLYRAFMKAFSYLPICAILNSSTFCIHGGLSPKLDHIDYLEKIVRPIHTFEEDLLFSDVVWSDPSLSSSCTFLENPRGLGNLFNGDAVSKFLKQNTLNRMIRAHQCVKNGSTNNFGDKCITVFSASSYNKEKDNFSAILQLFQKDDKIKIFTFPPIQRLKKNEAFYYKVQNINEERTPICFSISNPILHLTATHRMLSINNLSRINEKKNEKLMKKQKSLFVIPNIQTKSPIKMSQTVSKPIRCDIDPRKIIKKRI